MASLGSRYSFITPAYIGNTVEAMSKEIPCGDGGELETVTDTLDRLGVSYEVTHVVEVPCSEDTGVLAVNNTSAPEPADAATDGGAASAPRRMPGEETKRYRVLKEVALHDKKWVKVDDLLPDGGRKQHKKLRAHLNKLADFDLLLKKKLDERHESNGKKRVGYAASEGVRREMAQYDSLNGGGE